MNAALEKLAGMDKLDVQTKAWRDKVREMAYDIEDCIDIFMHQHGQGDDKDSLVNKTAHKITKLRARYQIANKIQSSKLVLRSRVKAEIGTGYMNLSQSLEWWKLTQGCPRCLRMQKGLSALMVHSQKSSTAFVWLWRVVNDRKFSVGTVFFSHTNQPAVLLHEPATKRTSQPNSLISLLMTSPVDMPTKYGHFPLPK